MTHLLPDIDDFERTGTARRITGRLGWRFAAARCRLRACCASRRPTQLRAPGPGCVLLAVRFAAGNWSTAKFALLPRPFFASPQALLEVFTDDYPRLGDSVLAFVCAAGRRLRHRRGVGFVAGVAIGWSRAVGYWAHPVLRLIGPLPATAWLPLAFFAFPSSHSASTFLIALATGFPVTVLTWSGVAGVNTRLLRRGPHDGRHRSASWC